MTFLPSLLFSFSSLNDRINRAFSTILFTENIFLYTRTLVFSLVYIRQSPAFLGNIKYKAERKARAFSSLLFHVGYIAAVRALLLRRSKRLGVPLFNARFTSRKFATHKVYVFYGNDYENMAQVLSLPQISYHRGVAGTDHNAWVGPFTEYK